MTQTRNPFEPLDEVSRATKAYDYLSGLPVGFTADFDTLGDVIDADDRMAVYAAVNDAMKRLEANDHRTVANVRGVGYRIVTASEHEGLARHHHGKAKRQLRKSIGKLKSADRSRLTQSERARFDMHEATLVQHAALIRRMDTRVTKVVAKQDQTDADSKATAKRLSEIEETLKKKGLM